MQSASRGIWSRPFPLSWSRLTDAFWRRQSVRGQLLIIFVLIEFLAGIVAGGVIILKARTATQVEMAASLDLAEHLVSEAVPLMQNQVPAERFLEDLASQLRGARHVRIGVVDASGRSLPVPTLPRTIPAGGEEDPSRFGWLPSGFSAPAPAWFAALIAPPIETRNVPVVVNGMPIGSVRIVSESKDEIGEAWENIAALAGVTIATNIGVIAILYVLFGRVLDPMTGLVLGLGELERRRYQVRLPRPQPREIAAIADQFNALAEALEASRAENLRLSTRLLNAQDDERRRTALDLHDEVGPSLFGLKANANSIARVAGDLDSDAARSIKERVDEIVSIIGHLEATNRSILNRLRPMALGHVPLPDLLSELVRDRQQTNPDIAFSFSGDALAASYGDSVDLTVYRCLQESLTNAIRHAKPRHVAVAIRESAVVPEAGGGSASELQLTVEDDGLGIDPSRPKGHGITGIQERVQALGGRHLLGSKLGCGTCAHIAIPLREGAGPGDHDRSMGGVG